MPVVRALLPAVAVLLTTHPIRPAAPDCGLKLQAGFVVTEFAGPELANDIYTLHISAGGRILVAGRGYVRELIDADGDGRADRAVDLVAGLKDGPMGVLLEGDVLYLVADGGLKRYHLRAGNPAEAKDAELILPVKTAGEHDAHAVRRGPDGWLYLLCGNMSGVTAKTVTSPASPVQDPNAGCLVRISPEGKRVEVVADGFRNPYDFDFNSAGDAFTFDSDNERCVSLPWYEPTRFYFIVPGGHHGWLSPQVAQTWRRPPYFWDVVPPVATVGRGSPTGVCCYRCGTFPDRYRDGFFLADWTFGRIVYVGVKPNWCGYAGSVEPFVQAVGDSGFAPTGLALHPVTGELYVSTGGRGTRGAVYRIRTVAPSPTPEKSELRPRENVLRTLLATAGEPDKGERIAELVRVNAGHEDRLVRQAAARLASRLPNAVRGELLGRAKTYAGRIALGFAAQPEVARRTALAVIATPTARTADRLDAVRLLQVSLGDLTDRTAVGGALEGYTPRRPIEPEVAHTAAGVVRTVFPTGHHDLDRELTRTLAALADDDPAAVTKVAATLTADSEPADDIHALIVLARLEGHRTPDHTRIIAEALLRLDEKADSKALPRDRHWPLRIGEAATALAHKDSRLSSALTSSPRFGRPGHIVFAHLPGVDGAAAARRFLARAADDPEFGWQADHVTLLGELPAGEIRGTLTRLWDRGGLEDALVPLLARHPIAADRDKFVAAVRSPQPRTVAAAAVALRKLQPSRGGDTNEVVALVRAMRTLPAAESSARKQVASTLRQWTGADLGPEAPAWVEWAARNRPDVTKVLSGDAAGISGARKRITGLDWSIGDPTAGKKVFTKASCSVCHNGAQAVGPSLEGVASRFSRDDLITAVIDPNRDVSPRYRVTRVSTDDGKVYQGVVIYEANDGVILQTGSTETVRVAGPRIEAKRLLDVSLMPGGLLDVLSDGEVADLFAYLKSLGKPSTTVK